MRIYTIILLMLMSLGAYAEGLVFSSPVNEKRYEALLPQIRCMLCENQSVADSQSPFSQDMRVWVHDAIEAGQTDSEIRAELIQRFGESVFYSPSMNSNTLMLWAAPLLFIIIAIGFWIRGRFR